MSLKLHCTSCGRPLRAPPRQAGQTVRCPSCGTRLTVPTELSDASPRRESSAQDAPDLIAPPEPDSDLLSPPLRAESSPPPLPAQRPPRPPKRKPRIQDRPLVATDSSVLALPAQDSTPLPAAESPPPLPDTTPPPPLLDATSPQPPSTAVPSPADAPPSVQPPPIPLSEPPPVPAPVGLPGVEHHWLKRWPVYQLGMWVMVVAVVSVIPALLDLLQHARQADSAGMSRWALALLLAGGLQIAYAVYLMQLPDWSTAWVMSVVMLVLATVYAALLGALTLAKPQSQFIQFLELGDKLPGHQATIWCLMMLVLSACLAYFSGRISFRWRRAYWRWERL